MSKQRVLFLCTGNSARSQMAEAFLRKYGGDDVEPHSAGLEPKGLNPLTIRVMEEVGIALSNQTSKSIDTYAGKTPFHYLVTVCDDADQNCPVGYLKANTRMHWSFEDPARFEGTEEEKLAKFREVRDLIENKVKSWVVERSWTTL
jgi:arsenate reductase (thioredoxin)